MKPPLNPKVKVYEDPEGNVNKLGDENDLGDTDFQDF